MNSIRNIGFLVLAGVLAGGVVCAGAANAEAQDPPVYHDRARGELSVGASAPDQESMLSAIRIGSPTQLFTVLEYGERVECAACVPLLQEKILTSEDARVREIAAWWLRRRTFVVGAVMRQLKDVLARDLDPVRRSRAAEAIGELMDPNGVAALAAAATSDVDASVRASAVRGLARINTPTAHSTLVAAMADRSAMVRLEAVSAVLRVNFFRNTDAILPLLADEDAAVRRTAARTLGALRVAGAATALAGLLRSDGDVLVRQAAAWALGRIGTAEARTALSEAAAAETVSLVRDAIEVARQMR
jgi:HEAT repeat protein